MGADNQAEAVIELWEETEAFVRAALTELNGHEPDDETVRVIRAKIIAVLREVRLYDRCNG